MTRLFLPYYIVALVISPTPLVAQTEEAAILDEFRSAATLSGDPDRGKAVFESQAAGCAKCHAISGSQRKAGPNLSSVGDKFSRGQMIRAVLEPDALIHPDYGTLTVVTTDGKTVSGVLNSRTGRELQLFDAQGDLVRISVQDIEQERRGEASLMPKGLHKTLSATQFADLIDYLTTLKQTVAGVQYQGLPEEIEHVSRPVRLQPLHTEEMRFDHPVWLVAVPGTEHAFLIVEQKTRRIYRFEQREGTDLKELFADFSGEATTGQFEGLMCLALHPNFRQNQRYFVNYHVRNQGCHFSPVIVERRATQDCRRDAGVPSRRLLQIPQDTDLHWGGMLAFGPDGLLYIGAGDAGPQEDPQGHGQDMSLLVGKILRIDVDATEGQLPYAIPDSNPFRSAGAGVRPEIWASGFRMPWRFSWDPLTGDLWVGEIGQDLFEEVTIVRVGENHGWNVYEAFHEFSDRYRRPGQQYTPPVISYRRRHGVSVTGGYVYRGKRSPSYYGAYIFADYESKRIWAAKQADRQLTQIRQIGTTPEKPSSFGVDAEGELLLIGHEGTIFRIVLDESVFE